MPRKKNYTWQITLIPLAVLLSIILPLPQVLLDFSLCINFTLSLLTVCWVFSLRSASSAKGFPSILLYLCLLRLGLNLASTRWIISSGVASPLIFALGSFFSLGNIFTSILVCFLLFFVNFLVVSKGAERIAEVRSRFVLDALPGRQMSLDADLLAGRLSYREVEAKKQKLIEESSFFSSMEGVFRFIKGDAILSCLLFILNAIAVTYLSYTLDYETQDLWLIVLGDALVSQVPALFTSCAAATLIEKIGEEDSLVEQLIEYYHNARQHFRFVSLFIFSLLGIANVPKLPIILLGSFLWLSYKENKIPKEESPFDQKFSQIEGVFSFDHSVEEIQSIYMTARDFIFQELGVPFPSELSVSLQENSCFLRLFDQTFNLVEVSLKEFVSTMRLVSWQIVRSDLILRYMEDSQRLFGIVVEEIIPRKLSITSFVALIRLLVKERISLRLFPNILEAIAVQYVPGENLEVLAEKIRKYLGKQIGQSLWKKEEVLEVITIDSHVEQMINDLYSRSKPVMRNKVVSQVSSILKNSSQGDFRAVVTGCETRFEVKKILEPHFPHLLVLAQSELPEEIPVTFLGAVSNEVLLP
ncbi:FHIPEP family type III secretion protein [Chlamydia sp. 17-3921]|uniref:FHIPEP family type III secretion protein n=1 Tax=Chlamydia sp. 17-3921 TaxID=2675798 RepID=UPI0019182440|nr:FHIPEP family type III secretion protein [Chlamydia sp. 17-3921]